MPPPLTKKFNRGILFALATLLPLPFFSACVSKDKRVATAVSLDPKLAAQYQAALAAKPDQACPQFITLGENKNFPLWLESRIRAAITCQFPVNLNVVDVPAHLRPLWSEAVLNQAKLNPVDISGIVKAYIGRSYFRSYQKEKVEDLRAALAASLRIGDDKLSKEVEYNLYQIAPRYNPNPDPGDFMMIGFDFMSARDFDQARSYFGKALEHGTSAVSQIQAHKAIRNSYKRQQNKPEFIAQSENYLKWLRGQKFSDRKNLHEAYITWARALWTEGEIRPAKKVLTLAQKALPSQEIGDEIEFIRGKMDEEEGKEKQALTHFNRSIRVNGPATPFGQRSLFSKAWTLRKLDRLPEAKAAFEDYERLAVETYEKFKARFWRAKVLKEMGLWELATSEFDRIAREDVLGYYGVISVFELKQDLPALLSTNTVDSPWPVLDAKIFNANEDAYVKSLEAVNDLEILRVFLKKKLDTWGLRLKPTSDSYISLLKLAAKAGNYPPLFGILTQLDTDSRRSLLTSEPDILFPEKYRDIVGSEAGKNGVPQELVYSIMRQESSFDPRARSPADAIGLMQVLPTEEEPSMERLAIPEINVAMGTALLKKLELKYHGQFILTAAAYNSSEKAIEHWLKTRVWSDPLEFIEEIPYEETRTYVKLVLRNFVFYSRLRIPNQSLAFPRGCIEDLQSFKLSTN